MPDVTVLPILAATLAAFVISSTWYGVLGATGVEPSDLAAASDTPPWKVAVELLRSLLVALVLAGLAVRGEIDQAAGALVFALAIWLAFPGVYIVGAVMWEGALSARRAALHAGDWLLKLVAIAAIVCLWQ